MMLISLFGKVVRRITLYSKKFSIFLKLLPKRFFSRFLVNLIGLFLVHDYKRKVTSRDKPHVLIIRNQYYDNGGNQISTEILQIDDTLIASTLATFDVLTYDVDLKLSPISDFQLIKKCIDIKPDAIILSSWSNSPTHPSISAFRFLRRVLHVPVAALWWDTCSDTFWKRFKPFIGEFDAHSFIDNPNLNHIDKENPFIDRVLPMWAPHDYARFKNEGERDIPVSFLGQVSSYRSYRSELIEYLLSKNVDGYFSTNERDKQVSHSEYASLLSRSKISINLSQSVSSHQCKGRVIESMFGGAMLLESENDQTSTLFEPMKDYVPFTSKEDLLSKINYYLDHENELNEIAKSGFKKAIKEYNAEKFWIDIFNKIDVFLKYN